MQNNNQNKHEFSLYWSDLSTQIKSACLGTLISNDVLLVHRIVIVLRMKVGSACVLFDYVHHVQVILSEIHKKHVVFTIVSIAQNEILHPSITAFLPVLKRDALEQAIYFLVEVGINAIQLLVTEKVQRTFQKKDYERLEKIIIAACEQSKQYAGVTVHEPVFLEQALHALDTKATKLYADPAGRLMPEVYEQLKDISIVHLVIMIGPEGDLTNAEKELLKQNQFIFCALTPTIVRSVHAAGLFAGVWRTLLR